jgi:hypothetical protein
MSGFYINRLIEAFRNENSINQISVVPEFLYIRDTDNEYRVLFCSNRGPEGKEIRPVDHNEILPDDSLYSLNYRAFIKIADWHRDLKRQSTR